jgi:hypothetical protein
LIRGSCRGYLHERGLGVLAALLALSGCGDEAEPKPGVQWEVRPTRIIELLEDSVDPLGDIQDLVVARTGVIYVADRYQPRVRAFGRDGALVSSFGQLGEGPFEFRTASAVSLDLEGRVLVLDGRLGRITRLTAGLEPDSLIYTSPRPRTQMRALGPKQVLTTAPGPRSTGITVFSQDWTPDWSTPSPVPSPPTEYPYMASVGRTYVATGPDYLALAFSLIYEVRVFSAGGEELYQLPIPDDWATVRVPKLGEFAGASGQEKMRAWMAESNAIVSLDVVADSLLVVTRGRLWAHESNRRSLAHEKIDVWSLRTGDYLLRSWDLPAGAEVVGGGDELVLLTGRPPAPWRIAFLEIGVQR